MDITKETIEIIKWAFKKIEDDLKSGNSQKIEKAKNNLLDWINQNRKLLFENKPKIKNTEVLIEFEYLLECASCLYEGKPFPQYLNKLQVNNDINPIHYKVDINLLRMIYVLCSDEIFKCSEADFYKAVESANFSRVTVIKKHKTQRLIYYLSKVMGSDWYVDAAKSKGWIKDNCSSATVPKDTDGWRESFEKIDKRFQRKLKGMQ